MADEGTKTITPEEFARISDAHKNAIGKLTNAEKELERFKGIDPEAARAWKEELENLRKDATGGDKAKIDKLIADKEKEISDRFSNALGEEKTKRGEAEKELKRLRVTNVAMQKAAGVFTKDSLKFIEREVESVCEWADGEIVVKGTDGKPMFSKKNPAQKMGIDEYLDTLSAEHPSITISHATGGTIKPGTTTTTTTGGVVTLEAYRKMTNQERAKLDPTIRFKLSQEHLSRKS